MTLQRALSWVRFLGNWIGPPEKLSHAFPQDTLERQWVVEGQRLSGSELWLPPRVVCKPPVLGAPAQSSLEEAWHITKSVFMFLWRTLGLPPKPDHLKCFIKCLRDKGCCWVSGAEIRWIEQWLSTLYADEMGVLLNLPDDSVLQLGVRATGIKRKQSDKRARKPPRHRPYTGWLGPQASQGGHWLKLLSSRSGYGCTGQKCCGLLRSPSCISRLCWPWEWGAQCFSTCLWNHYYLKPWCSGFRQKCMLPSEEYCI